MPPNLLVKAAFVRGGDYDSPKKVGDDKKIVRTDFILQNIYSHLIRNSATFQAISATNKREEDVLKSVIELTDSFRNQFLCNQQHLWNRPEFTENILGTVLQGISNELFSEGINWYRIVALFAYVGELTLYCLAQNFSDDIVDGMYECFCRLVKENLTGWVEDHGGWAGIQSLTEPQGSSPSHTNSNQELVGNKGWAKSLLHGTVRIFGTLAQIANTTGQTF